MLVSISHGSIIRTSIIPGAMGGKVYSKPLEYKEKSKTTSFTPGCWVLGAECFWILLHLNAMECIKKSYIFISCWSVQAVSSSCDFLSSCYRLQKKKTLFLIGPHKHYSVMKDIIGSLISNLGDNRKRWRKGPSSLLLLGFTSWETTLWTDARWKWSNVLN